MKPLGVGFLVVAATPVAVVVLGLTIVGLPLALLTLATWLASLYLAGILTGALLGSLLLAGRGVAPRFPLSLLVGLLALTIAANIPYLGALARLLALLVGLGIGAAQAARAWRSAPVV